MRTRFRTFLASSLVLSLAAACSAEVPGDETAVTHEAIINGTNVSTPASLGLLSINGGSCSGVLLNNDWALTAQHCVNVESQTGNTAALAATATQTTSDRVYAFGQHDIALMHLATPLAVNGSTSGFSYSLWPSDTASLASKTLSCYGLGDNAVPNSGLGTWRTAQITVNSTGTDQYSLTPNSAGQIEWLGDSGGPCFLASGGTTYLTGIQSGASYTCSGTPCVVNSVTSASQASLPFVRNWINSILEYQGIPGSLSGSPSLVQSAYGIKGDFEFATPMSSGGIGHYWRENDDAAETFSGPITFAQSLGVVDGVSMIYSSFGNLELAATSNGALQFYWKTRTGAWPSAPNTIARGVRGTPALVQPKAQPGAGNFELAVPSASGGIDYYWRNNADSTFPWNRAPSIGQTLGLVDGVAMIQTPWGSMEIVARVGQSLYHLYRDTTFTWHGPNFIGNGASGNPSFVQSHIGTNGNFEVAVPSAAGGFDYYFKVNDPTPSTNGWSGPVAVLRGVGTYDAGSLIQSNLGPASGDMELFFRQGTRAGFSWREQVNFPTTFGGTAGDFRWNGPYVLTTGRN